MAEYIVYVDGEAVTGALDEAEAEAARSEYPGSELVEVPEQFEDEMPDNERSFFEYCKRVCADPSNPTEDERFCIDNQRAYSRLTPQKADSLRKLAGQHVELQRFMQQAGY